MRGPAYVSEPQVQYLSQLLDEVAAGHLQVPRFQRGFVWSDEQRLELLRSVRDGLPIGSILLWRTARRELPRSQRLGPHALPPLEATAGVSQYLLDGHQRVTTLFGALYPGERTWRAGSARAPAKPAAKTAAETDEEGRSWAFYYDLVARDFVLDHGEAPPLHWLPLFLLLDSVALLAYQRSALKKDAALIRAADQIARRFRETKIPVIPFVTDDLNLATQAFQRINSQGTPMGQLDMVAALVYGEDFDLRDRLDALQEEVLDLGWALGLETLYRTVKLALGFSSRSGEIDGISRRLRAQPTALDEAKGGLRLALRFLAERCGIYSQRALPDQQKVLALADWLREHPQPLTESQAQDLLRWFWLTSYLDVPSSEEGGISYLANFMKFRAGGYEVLLAGGNLHVPKLPPRFDFRAAPCRLLALRLAELRPSGMPVEAAQQLLAREGARALSPLIPGSEANTLSPWVRRWLRSPANYLLIAPGAVGATRRRLVEEWPEEELRSHGIALPSDAPGEDELWEQIFAARAARLDELAVEFLQALVGPADQAAAQPR